MHRIRRPRLIADSGLRDLGVLIRTARERHGLSVAELGYRAALTGETLSQSHLRRLESGVSRPNWDTLAVLSATDLFLHPQTGQPLTPHDLFDVCTGDADWLLECADG